MAGLSSLLVHDRSAAHEAPCQQPHHKKWPYTVVQQFGFKDWDSIPRLPIVSLFEPRVSREVGVRRCMGGATHRGESLAIVLQKHAATRIHTPYSRVFMEQGRLDNESHGAHHVGGDSSTLPIAQRWLSGTMTFATLGSLLGLIHPSDGRSIADSLSATFDQKKKISHHRTSGFSSALPLKTLGERIDERHCLRAARKPRSPSLDTGFFTKPDSSSLDVPDPGSLFNISGKEQADGSGQRQQSASSSARASGKKSSSRGSKRNVASEEQQKSDPKGKKKKTTPTGASEEENAKDNERLWACPLYKFDRDINSRCAKGFKGVPDVAFHIKQCHRKKKPCVNCQDVVTSLEASDDPVKPEVVVELERSCMMASIEETGYMRCAHGKSIVKKENWLNGEKLKTEHGQKTPTAEDQWKFLWRLVFRDAYPAPISPYFDGTGASFVSDRRSMRYLAESYLPSMDKFLSDHDLISPALAQKYWPYIRDEYRERILVSNAGGTWTARSAERQVGATEGDTRGQDSPNQHGQTFLMRQHQDTLLSHGLPAGHIVNDDRLNFLTQQIPTDPGNDDNQFGQWLNVDQLRGPTPWGESSGLIAQEARDTTTSHDHTTLYSYENSRKQNDPVQDKLDGAQPDIFAEWWDKTTGDYGVGVAAGEPPVDPDISVPAFPSSDDILGLPKDSIQYMHTELERGAAVGLDVWSGEPDPDVYNNPQSRSTAFPDQQAR